VTVRPPSPAVIDLAETMLPHRQRLPQPYRGFRPRVRESSPRLAARLAVALGWSRQLACSTGYDI